MNKNLDINIICNEDIWEQIHKADKKIKKYDMPWYKRLFHLF